MPGLTEEQLEQTRQRIKQHEGYRAEPYRCTSGDWTVGYGTNLRYKQAPSGLVLASILDYARNRVRHEDWFELDFNLAYDRSLAWLGHTAFEALSPGAQSALIEMSYQLGNRINTFVLMRRALIDNHIETAANELMNSRYRLQTPARVGTLAVMIATGRIVGD